jgi:hypothetical protein
MLLCVCARVRAYVCVSTYVRTHAQAYTFFFRPMKFDTGKAYSVQFRFKSKEWAIFQLSYIPSWRVTRQPGLLHNPSTWVPHVLVLSPCFTRSTFSEPLSQRHGESSRRNSFVAAITMSRPVLGSHSASYPLGTGVFSRGKAAGAWSWSHTSIYCWGLECVELYLHSPICIRSVALKLSTRATALFNCEQVSPFSQRQVSPVWKAKTHTHTYHRNTPKWVNTTECSAQRKLSRLTSWRSWPSLS